MRIIFGFALLGLSSITMSIMPQLSGSWRWAAASTLAQIAAWIGWCLINGDPTREPKSAPDMIVKEGQRVSLEAGKFGIIIVDGGHLTTGGPGCECETLEIRSGSIGMLVKETK